MSERVDPPVTRDMLCVCPCHTVSVGLCEQCCESATAWNAALQAVIDAHVAQDDWDWDEGLILSLRKEPPKPVSEARLQQMMNEAWVNLAREDKKP